MSHDAKTSVMFCKEGVNLQLEDEFENETVYTVFIFLRLLLFTCIKLNRKYSEYFRFFSN